MIIVSISFFIILRFSAFQMNYIAFADFMFMMKDMALTFFTSFFFDFSLNHEISKPYLFDDPLVILAPAFSIIVTMIILIYLFGYFIDLFTRSSRLHFKH